MSTDTSQRICIQTWPRDCKRSNTTADLYFEDQAFETIAVGLIYPMLRFSDEGATPITLAELTRAMIWALIRNGVKAKEIKRLAKEAAQFEIWLKMQAAQGRLSEEE